MVGIVGRPILWQIRKILGAHGINELRDLLCLQKLFDEGVCVSYVLQSGELIFRTRKNSM
jgi:hypothetical protein